MRDIPQQLQQDLPHQMYKQSTGTKQPEEKAMLLQQSSTLSDTLTDVRPSERMPPTKELLRKLTNGSDIAAPDSPMGSSASASYQGSPIYSTSTSFTDGPASPSVSSSRDESTTSIRTDSSGVSKQTLVISIESAIEGRVIRPILPQDLIKQLSFAVGQNQSVLADASPEWQQPMDMLLVDLRPLNSYKESMIKTSINLVLPSLMVKRFRRKSISSFNITNFLTTQESMDTLEAWRTSLSKPDQKQKVIVIYDDETSQGNFETACWAFCSALADGYCADLYRGSNGNNAHIVYMQGGFNAFRNLPQSAMHLASASCLSLVTNNAETGSVDSQPESPHLAAKLNAKLGALDLNSSGNSETRAKSPSGPVVTPVKKKLGLSIDTNSTSRPHQGKSKPGGLSISTAGKPAGLSISTAGKGAKKHSNLSKDDTSTPITAIHLNNFHLPVQEDADPESPAMSANDEAAPPEPYSRVSENIYLGSDAIPSAPDAVDQFLKLGVTHILNMAAEINNNQAVVESDKLKFKWLPVHDNTEQDMDGPLREAIDFINGAISNNPKAIVFVHCRAGRSRSVSVVIGYLVTVQKFTLKTAYALVRKCRRGVSPNLGFMAALLKVEKETHGFNSQISELYG